MDIAGMVKEISAEIEAMELRMDQLVRELYGIERIRDTHKISVSKYFEQKNRLEKAIESYEAMIDDKERTKREMIEKLESLDGLERKIVMMNKVQGAKLREIAEEMGYSYIYIKKISARANGKLKRA